MSVIDVKETIELINKHPNISDFVGKINPVWIDQAEKVLGIKFPTDYKYFLENLGCGDIYGVEFYGIIKDNFINSGIPDAIWLTLKERKESELPDYLVIVYFGGDGDYYAIDCRDPSNAPIVYWAPGASKPNDKLYKVADDFGCFFKETIFNAQDDDWEIGD
ncbi:SMI1/KNR4 family protein [Neisseriaceae bacterium ESL0693]|nr:SMI1/KNR4 family protein [Neisseriaceae bacterium ESL0693]